MAKPIRLRSLAAEDIEAAVDHCQREAGLAVAGRLIDAVERTLARIGRHPHVGALRYSYDLDIRELRYIPLARFPYAVFYLDATTEIDVWRVLHTYPAATLPPSSPTPDRAANRGRPR